MHLKPCQKNAQVFLTVQCRAGTPQAKAIPQKIMSAPSPGSDVTSMAEAGCDSLSFTSR